MVDAIDSLKASGAELNSTEIDIIRNCAGVGYPGMRCLLTQISNMKELNVYVYLNAFQLQEIQCVSGSMLFSVTGLIELQTGSAVLSFFLAMMLHPEIQRRAQAELDFVCPERLPEFSDRQNLPYIDALCTELLRWSSIGPIGKCMSIISLTINGVVFTYFH